MSDTELSCESRREDNNPSQPDTEPTDVSSTPTPTMLRRSARRH